MLGRVMTAALYGTRGLPVSVESHVGAGLPAFITVGLPDTAVRESRVRVEAALKNSGFALPSRRVIVNLAPADVKKEGAAYDFAIALATLSGLEVIPQDKLNDLLVVGELGLDGSLRAVSATVIYAKLCQELGFKGLILPAANQADYLPIADIECYYVNTLSQVVNGLNSQEGLSAYRPSSPPSVVSGSASSSACFSEVRGLSQVKRALQIAAIGGHHVLVSGPPGVGKTMLIERMPSILPALSDAEWLEVLSLYALSEETPHVNKQRPFRAPHHSLSTVALIGGGSSPRPGEISLAHRGILFLDEFSEFKTEAINALRQPMESGQIMISRAQRKVVFDAVFQLIAATNPCPCGYLGHPTKACRCTKTSLERYRTRLIGPVSDRFDLSVKVSADASSWGSTHSSLAEERSETMMTRIAHAWQFRQTRAQLGFNRDLKGDAIKQHCGLSDSSQKLLFKAANQFSLSSRGIDRVLRVARSIADLRASCSIEDQDLAEALQFRHDFVNHALF